MRQLSILILFLYSTASAQNYDVRLIPDSLKENSNAVKRFEELRVIIKSAEKAVIKHKWAITILNEAGANHSWYFNSYDKLQSLDDISGKLFDGNGKHIRSIKKREISDLSTEDNMSLITDNRVKQFNFYHINYPYTVEFEDEQTYNGVFFLPTWSPVESDLFSVQQSQLVVEAYNDYVVRYKCFPSNLQPIFRADKNSKSMVWNLSNFKGFESESFQPRLTEILPNVKLAPSNFEIQGYKGNMNSWFEFGKFRQTLYAGRDILPEFIKDSIRIVTKGLNTDYEKIEALYRFMQRNTRYISIQLGIGGWQPFEASFVAAKKYGDCKALSNFMMALLKEVGIKGNMVAIYSGKGNKGLDESFPSNQFNHIVLNVPLTNDTLWLECTSQTTSPGYMGSSTSNRKALMIGDNGGYVVKTPPNTSSDNLQLRTIHATIDEQGNLIAESRTYFTGEQHEIPHSLIHYFNDAEKKRHLNEELNLPTYKIEEIQYSEKAGRKPSVDEYLKVSAPLYASVTGKRLFIEPNLFTKSGTKLNTDKPRKFDIDIKYAFRDVDTIFITIPSGYQPEALPKDVNINNKFGKYSISYKVVENAIEVLRIHEQDRATYPASDFEQFAKFYLEIYKTDRNKIVFVKKEL